jgi:putative flippase GtrA
MTAVRRERPLLERGWRYTVVGLVCALANYVAMLAVDFLGGHYLLGILVGFLVVTPLGYVLHSWFTFSEPFSLRAFSRFAATVIAAYPVATAMLIILCSGLGLSVAIAYPIAVAGMFAWNFAAAHWAILPRFELAPAILSRTSSTEQADDPKKGTQQ